MNVVLAKRISTYCSLHVSICGRITLSVFLEDTTNKFVCFFSTLSLFMLNTKQGSCEYQFSKAFDLTQRRNRNQVHRIRGRRSNRSDI